MKKELLNIIIVAIIVGGGAFYAGMEYANNIRGKFLQSDPQKISRNFKGPAGTDPNRIQKGAGPMTFGVILAKDDKSITIKLSDSGSKIIFTSASTQVTKTITGLLDDLIIGTQVMAVGNTNSDGSVNAQSIQIRQPLPISQPK